jgi:CHAT domain/WD domain, G-beta repeat
METSTQLVLESWLKPLINLIGEREFREAYALSEYFPDTHSRKLVQLAALLGQNKVAEASILLNTFDSETSNLVVDFATILSHIDLNIFEVGSQAIQDKYFALADFCIELQLHVHPEAIPALLDWLSQIAAQMLSIGNFDRGKIYLEKAIELDNSSTRMIQYAEVLLVNKPEESGYNDFMRSVGLDGQTIFSDQRKHNLNDQSITQTSQQHKGDVLCVAFSSDTNLMVTGGSDKTLRLWNLKGSLIKPPFQGHEGAIRSVAFSRDSQLIVSSSDDKTIRLWDLHGNPIGQPFTLHDDWVNSAKFTPDNLLIVINSDDKTIRLWDLHGNPIGQPFTLHDDWVNSVIFSSDNQLIVSSNDDKTIRLWDLNGNPIGQPFTVHDDWVNSVIFSSDSQLIVSSNDDKTIRLWDLNGNLIGIHKNILLNLQFTFALNLICQASEQLNEEDIDSLLKLADIFAENMQVLGLSRQFYATVNLPLQTMIQNDISNRKEIISNYFQLVQLANKVNEVELSRLSLRIATEFSAEVEEISREISNHETKNIQLPNDDDSPRTERIGGGMNVLNKFKDFMGLNDEDYSDYDETSADAYRGEYSLPGLRPVSDGSSDENVAEMIPPPWINSIEERRNIERYTRIDFPLECDLDKKVDLKIQLTREIPRFTRVLKKIALTVGIKTEQIKLNVNITAPGFAVRPYQQQLIFPVNGDSNEVIFILVPLETGNQVIEIEFFLGTTRVGYVLVQTNVSSDSYCKKTAKIRYMEDPINGLNTLKTMAVNPDKQTLHVNWIEKECKLLYTIYPASRLGEWDRLIPNIQLKIEDDLRNLNAFLTEVVQQGNPSDERWDSICFNLQGVGANLFEMLIPSEVAKQVRTWKIGSSLIISTNEQWIPWELMYDGEDFLGKKFILARYPRLTEGHALPDRSRAESQGDRQIKQFVNVVGGDVPIAEADRATQLFSTFLPLDSVKLLSKQPISVLVKALQGSDALHCTCHGHLEPHLLQIAGDKNKARLDNLLPETIQRLPLEPGSLVFVNACASTVPVLTFGKFSSFGWQFYQRGAAVFIGTLGSIPVKHAINFAEIVYRELFNQDERISIGQAVARAKEVAATESKLVLAVVLYLWRSRFFV